MADIKSPEERSRNMAAIKSNDTKPEMLVRRFLHAAGYRYTLRNKKYPGSPDIVLPRLHTVIFVNGCFWHGHENCKYFRLPKSNSEFWKTKIQNNTERDAKAIAALEEMGWLAITIWECELRTKERRETTLQVLSRRLGNIENGTYNHPHYPMGDEDGTDYLFAAEPDASSI